MLPPETNRDSVAYSGKTKRPGRPSFRVRRMSDKGAPPRGSRSTTWAANAPTPVSGRWGASPRGFALGANRTRRDSGNDVNDPGCVKTQKIAERRECFFLDGTKSDLLTNFWTSKRAFAKCVFYRIRSPKRFYTAKTRSGHRSHGLPCSHSSVT